MTIYFEPSAISLVLSVNRPSTASGKTITASPSNALITVPIIAAEVNIFLMGFVSPLPQYCAARTPTPFDAPIANIVSKNCT